MKFTGSKSYVATEDLKVAVNASITLERPLLIKGEPGTGKTVLAIEVAKALGVPLIEWHIKSTTKAQQGLYEYDAVSRLRDSQLGDERVKDIANYIKRGKLWEAFTRREAPGAADRRDRQGRHRVPERPPAGARSHGVLRLRAEQDDQGHTQRPIVMITSNNEKELPDAFLRRCFFHYIKFPDPETMRAIVEVHFPGLKGMLVSDALKIFYDVREVPGIKKKPSTSELLDWLKLLHERGHRAGDAAREGPEEAHSAAAWRAIEERAGRAPLRAAGLHGQAPAGRLSPRHPDSTAIARP